MTSMAKHEWSLDELRYKAEAYCAGVEHCCSDVYTKLQQWGATHEQSDAIIAHLIQQRYIDEQRYCRAFAHDKLLYQGWGRLKIKAALYAKYLPSSNISEALENLDKSDYRSTLQRVIATKKRAIKSSDPMAREKLIRFCLQRGFTYDEIEDLL